MHKSIVFLAALTYVQVSLAAVSIWIENNDNSKNKALWVPDGKRYCYCLSSTQTAYIDGRGAGVVKLFGKADCTGNFVDGSGTVTSNAQWVNSVSFGASGVPSTWGGGTQCNQYA